MIRAIVRNGRLAIDLTGSAQTSHLFSLYNTIYDTRVVTGSSKYISGSTVVTVNRNHDNNSIKYYIVINQM